MKESEVEQQYQEDVYLNVLKAVIIISYFLILNLIYLNINAQNFQMGIKILTMIFLFVSIFIFEKAYKKDDSKLTVQGIEILVFATYTLISQHITTKFNFEFKNYSVSASYIFAIYFILKAIVVYTKGRKKIVDEFSDIKEIVKKEEPVKKEATKKKKEQKILTDKKENKTTKKIADNGTDNKTNKTEKTQSKNKKTKGKNAKNKNTKKKTSKSTQKENNKIKKEVKEND